MKTKIACDGNSISMDFKSMMNPDMFKQYKDIKMKAIIKTVS